MQWICIEIHHMSCVSAGLDRGKTLHKKSSKDSLINILLKAVQRLSLRSLLLFQGKFAAPDISLSKKCQKCTKRCNCHSHKQLPCHRKSRYLGVPLWPRNCNTRTSAPLPRFSIWQRLFSCVTSPFPHRSALVVGRGWGISPPGWLRASLIWVWDTWAWVTQGLCTRWVPSQTHHKILSKWIPR